MKRIYKYPLIVTDQQDVLLPMGADILTIQTQADTPCLWALVDPGGATEARVIEIFGTGHVVREDMGVSRKYITTFQLADGALVFHAFERTS